MELQYLVFDASEDEAGNAGFDAMAAVRPDRLPALLAEVGAVLRWSQRVFGPPGPPPEAGEWDHEVQAVAEPGGPLAATVDAAAGTVALAPAPAGSLVTVTLTLSGSPAYAEAFRAAFPEQD